jgi:ankyrin repeat protein
LIQKGADVSIKAQGGLQPIHAAVGSYGSLEMVDYLLESGANIDAEDDEGRTPIFYAVVDYNMEAISHLGEKGANVNHRDHAGMTPAHYAVQDEWDGIEMLTILNSFGLLANVKDNSDKTPEDYAASEEIKEFLKTLY